MRGICYSPVPWGDDPGYAEPYGDYFTSQYEPLFARDLALMAEMGANTVRVYTWSTSARHGTFLDMAHHLGLAVVAVFEMGTAEQTPLVEPRDLAYAQTRLQAKVRATGGHPPDRALLPAAHVAADEHAVQRQVRRQPAVARAARDVPRQSYGVSGERARDARPDCVTVRARRLSRGIV